MNTSAESPAPVRQIANAIAGWIDRLGPVWVEGQIAQFNRRQGMATVFVTLRDTVADISIPVTVSRQIFDSMNPPVVEGASVVILGKPSYYANRGTLSLQAREIRMVGLGELLARLERRRQLLAAEGLFDAGLKRSLPFLPTKVGLVTAPSSAAERDVLEVARRRWPQVRFEVRYAAMQGPKCVPEVIESLRRLDADPAVDVIVVARGGGSIEDLLPFSDEALIRAVHQTRTPVVSAIGHEPDSPLLDLVADIRAATPTDAAKLVVPDVRDELDRVTAMRDRGRGFLTAWLAREVQALATMRTRPVLADPRGGLADRSRAVQDHQDRARRALGHQLDRATDALDHHLARVRSLSPMATMQRGYAVLQDGDGRVLTSVADVSAGQSLDVRVLDGRVHVTADSTDQTDQTDQTVRTPTGEARGQAG